MATLHDPICEGSDVMIGGAAIRPAEMSGQTAGVVWGMGESAGEGVGGTENGSDAMPGGRGPGGQGASGGLAV